MKIDEMRKLLHLAQSQNHHVSAAALNITPGALSKTLTKIEAQLNSTLFDRIGRNIQLNVQGQKFVTYASKLVHEYEQMYSEFTGKAYAQHINITGPSVLINHCMNNVLPYITAINAEVTLVGAYEGLAIKMVASGQSHFAVVTNEAILDMDAMGLKSVPLGKTSFKIAASATHPLIVNNNANTIKDLVEHAFVCPASSPFCGVVRGIGSDGWPDHQYPRKIQYRTDDINSLLSLVKQGYAIAFVPDLVIASNGLREIKVKDFDYNYLEHYCLVYKPSIAFGWLNKLVDSIVST